MAHTLDEVRRRLRERIPSTDHQGHDPGNAEAFFAGLLSAYGFSDRKIAAFQTLAQSFHPSLVTPATPVFHLPGLCLMATSPPHHPGTCSAAGEAHAHSDFAAQLPIEQAPRWMVILTSDTVRVHDLLGGGVEQFQATNIGQHVESLGFLAGYPTNNHTHLHRRRASLAAIHVMTRLHQALEGHGWPCQEANRLIVRMVFALYADDAGIWPRDLMYTLLTSHPTNRLAQELTNTFEEIANRSDGSQKLFPHLDVEIFTHPLKLGEFSPHLHELFIQACHLNWAGISPTVFATLVQTTQTTTQRRGLGEHYTSEANILKTIGPLFLDELKGEFHRGWDNATLLEDLRQRIRNTRLLDPACGGGNFLVVAYQQLHQLDRQIVQRLRSLHCYPDKIYTPAMTVDQCGGIEINQWPAQVGAAALMVACHQANRAWELTFGVGQDSPLHPVNTIVVGNALRLCWSQVFTPSPDVVVLGNPPFVGQYTKSLEQTADLRHVWGESYSGYLDYVTGWFAKAAEYFYGVGGGRFGFVATNSIAQGRSVPDLFRPLFKAGWRLRFAHQTFAWTSETNHEAGVHCVVVGFDRRETSPPRLFTYQHPKADPVEEYATHINAYLIDGPNVFITPRTTPLSPRLPQATKGSQPTDQGHLLLDSRDYERVVNDPHVGKYVHAFVGAKELIHNRRRWCLWLENLDAADVEASTFLRERLEGVREFREGSAKSTTRNAASTPHLFTERRQPRLPYVCIPSHFSEIRPFPTVGLFDPGVIAGNANFTAADPDGYLFGIVSSSMFLTWQKTVGGRLESRLRFSNTIVWNNLPLPQTSASLRQRIIQAGQGVLNARKANPERSLAQLYEPSSMTPELLRAHTQLDRVVDQAFGATTPLSNDAERQALLFHQYERFMEKQQRDTH